MTVKEMNARLLAPILAEHRRLFSMTREELMDEHNRICDSNPALHSLRIYPERNSGDVCT